MVFAPLRHSTFFKTILSVAALVTACPLFVPGAAWAQAPAAADPAADGSLAQELDEVSALRINGDYEGAAGLLHEIIQANLENEDVLQRAYNELVWTYYQDKSHSRELEAAREALERIPSLTANTIDYPPAVNDLYEQLRKEMYGSLTIEKPEECQVSLDGEYQGDTPLELPLIRVGAHEILVTKEGYKEYASTIFIDPDENLTLEPPLPKDRSTGWWLTRVGLGVAAVVTVGLVASGSSESTPPAEPLAVPPDPPADTR
jgi:hypothetical protein